MPTLQYNWDELSKELDLETVLPEGVGRRINLTVHGNNYRKIRAKSRGWTNSELANCLRKYGDCFFDYVDAKTRSDDTILVFRADIGSKYVDESIYGKTTRKLYFDQVKKLDGQDTNPLAVLDDSGIKSFFYPQIREANKTSVGGIIVMF